MRNDTATSTPGTTGQAERVLRELFRESDEKRIVLYQNLLGQPYMRLAVDEYPPADYPVPSAKASQWMTCFAWDRLETLLRHAEVDRLLSVLAGHAQRNPLGPAKKQLSDFARG